MDKKEDMHVPEWRVVYKTKRSATGHFVCNICGKRPGYEAFQSHTVRVTLPSRQGFWRLRQNRKPIS